MKLHCLPLIVLVFVFSPRASARDSEGGIGDRGRPYCNMSRVEACRSTHCPAAGATQGAADSLITELGAIDDKRKETGDRKLAYEQSAARAERQIQLLTAELKFLHSQGAPRAEAALLPPGFPSLEDFFSRHPLERSWRERFPTERAAKLSERLGETRKEKTDLAAILARITGEFAALNDEYQSKAGRRNNLLAEAREHAVMCENGCREAFCP